MSLARKLALNLGWRAMRVLGPRTYLRYLLAFFRTVPSIFRTGNFSPLDRAMGARSIKVHMDGIEFVIDCAFTDQHIVDGAYTFGLIREMYIRNCYLRHGVSEAAAKARTVVDLGANRGAFSIMMARQASLVISVEFNPIFQKVIAHNMAVNGFTNYKIETAFVGEGGVGGDISTDRLTIPDLLRKYDMETIDLLKMDIEGSEFALFRSPQWLSRVSALCMEVHPKYGDPQEILTALKSHSFDYAVADSEFRAVEDPKRADFIYAWKRDSEGATK